MAFFDEIGRKITQTGQKAMQKTKDFADVAKLNANVTSMEKEIQNLYGQIGQLYVSLHGEAPESAFAELVRQLQDTTVQVDALKKQIQELKGVKRCVYCGAENPNHATFCSNCGSAILPQEAANTADLVVCPHCGKGVERGMNFCTFCGSAMPSEPVQEQLGVTCSCCGAAVPKDADFCNNCGASVAGQTNLQTEKAAAHTPENEPEETQQLVCPSCGEPVAADAAFCAECGSKIQN